MRSFIFSRLDYKLVCAALLLVTAAGHVACSAPAEAAVAVPAPAALAAVDYSGDQLPLADLDRAIKAAGKDSTRIAALVSALVPVLQQPGITVAARQAVCQRLGLLLPDVGDQTPALAALYPLLTDERYVDVARLALEPVPGKAVDALFLRGLRAASGHVRLALVQSSGNRRLSDAVPMLAPLLADADKVTASAAAQALGQVGTRQALGALDAAPDPRGTAVLDAKIDCAWRLPAREGTAVLNAVFADKRVPAARRAAAFRGLLTLEPAAASTRIVEALGGDEPALKAVAIESIFALESADIVPQLGSRLTAWDAPTQAAVIAALGRKGVAAAGPAIVVALAHADAQVRVAAIEALGRLPGDAGIAQKLSRIAAEGSTDEGKMARMSLSTLTGPGVADAVLAGARAGEPGTRGVFLEAIALRGMVESVPVLLAARQAEEAPVRAAALTGLSSIAPASAQAELLAWTIGAKDPTELARAQRALVNVSLRNPDAAARALPIVHVLDRGEPAIQLRLLPVLPRLNAPDTGACAGRLALVTDRAVAREAVATLGRWPDDSILGDLVTAAEKAPVAEARATAVQLATRVLERSRTVPSAEPSALVIRLIKASTDVAARKQLVSILGHGASEEARTFAESLSKDSALSAAAIEATAAIRANRVWPPIVTASANAGQVNAMVDGKSRTFWSVPVTTGQWVQVDFKQARPLHRITLDQTGRVSDFAEKLEVFVTDNPDTPGTARAGAAGRRDRTVIELPPGINGRYLLIKNTGTRTGGSWAIVELQVD